MAIVALTAVVAACTVAFVAGLVHPRLTPRRALTALGQFNEQAAAPLAMQDRLQNETSL